MAASPPEIPWLCLSAMALRVDGDIQVALESMRGIIRRVSGTILDDQRYNLTGRVQHPDGRTATVVVDAYRVQGQDYIELCRESGDARLGAEVYRMLIVDLTSPDMTRRMASPPGLAPPAIPPPPPQKKTTYTAPAPPKYTASCDPHDNVPPLCMGMTEAEEDLGWQALEGIASWPRDELRDFAVAHEDVSQLFTKGTLQPITFEQHMLKIPKQIRQGLKWHKRHWNVLPPNTATLLEQTGQIICEAELFWTLHDC